MVVLALRLDLHLPEVRSLKEKRAVIKPVIEGARRRYSVAVGEVARQDQWQRAELEIAVVSAQHGHATEVMDEVERFVWSFPELEVVDAHRRWIEED